MSRMLGLTPSELGIVVFIFLLVVVAAKLPAWGEKLGEFLNGRHDPSGRDPKGTRPSSAPPPGRTPRDG